MDCKACRKYIGAFADGELEIQQNLEALEHLNMCPRCAARVEEIAGLRATLVRIYGRMHAPQALRERLQRSLETQPATPPRTGQVPSLTRPRRRLTVPLGVAAGLVLVASLWPGLTRTHPRPGTVTVVAGRAVADIREQHRQCTRSGGAGHHAADLPREVGPIAERLSEEFKLVVIAPDLSGRGFELVGADRCGIQGRRGAHVLYRSRADATLMLSVFTVPRIATLGSGGGDLAEEAYLVSTDEPLGVVAWHAGRQTYALCGALSEARLLDLAGGSRTANAGDPARVFRSLAIVLGTPTG